MRHRRRGRTLGRSPSHRKALLKNLASALFLTERDAEFDDNAPKVPGRITTTLHKAKEVKSLVEKCITIAKKSLPHAEEAESTPAAPIVAATSTANGGKVPTGKNGLKPGRRSSLHNDASYK